MALSPKLSGEFIVKNAKYLTVNEEGVDTIVKQIISGIQTKTIDIENFSQHQYHPQGKVYRNYIIEIFFNSSHIVASDPRAINWVFLVDTLNFCFWTPGHDATKWKVDGQTGYFGLCAAISRAIAEGIDFTNPAFYSKITIEKLSHILRSDDGFTICPLITERVECLHQVGLKLIEKFNGNFENCVKSCEHSAEKLLYLIVEDFECFKDEATYNGQRVQILKRAQILVGDIWACFRGEGLGRFDDLEKITMFADYRVPQVLVHFGALEYSDEMMATLRAGEFYFNQFLL